MFASDHRLSRLSEFGRNLTTLAAEGRLSDVVGREDELSRLVRLLTRQGPNSVLITGPAGCGKTALVEGLAVRIALGHVPELAGYILFELDPNALTAGTMYRGQLEERYSMLLNELKSDGRSILVIDEIHRILGNHGMGASDDLSQALKPLLARGEITVIGITTTEEWMAGPGRDKAFDRRFAHLALEELSPRATVEVLRKVLEDGVKEYGVAVIQADDKILRRIVDASSQIPGLVRPDNAIRLLKDILDAKAEASKTVAFDLDPVFDVVAEEVRFLERGDFQMARECISRYRSLRGLYASPSITETDIQVALARITGAPLKDQLAKSVACLETALKERIVGQRRAISAICSAFRRVAVGLRRGPQPIGAFLFIGPTGVGKTELARALADVLFGGHMIRFDMSEFSEEHSVSKLIGAPPGYVGHAEGGHLTTAIQERPFSIVVFDEAEKAHPRVLKLLLQICEEGSLTDSRGRRVSFTNATIILTSNFGATQLLSVPPEAFNDHYGELKESLMPTLMETLSPELVNRLDDIILFAPLSWEEAGQVFDLLLKGYLDLIYERNNITVEVTSEAKAFMLDQGFNPYLGARPLRRAIETLLIDPLSQGILNGSFADGTCLVADVAGPNATGGIRIGVRQ